MIVHHRDYEAELGYDKEYLFSVSDWYVLYGNDKLRLPADE